jgi:hypothetical protein
MGLLYGFVASMGRAHPVAPLQGCIQHLQCGVVVVRDQYLCLRHRSSLVPSGKPLDGCQREVLHGVPDPRMGRSDVPLQI